MCLHAVWKLSGNQKLNIVFIVLIYTKTVIYKIDIREAVGLTTVTLREGKHLDNMPALMAHEMGHILGSPHDGTERGNYAPDITSYNIPGTCPENLYIMTPSQSGTIVEWSECSR